VNVQVADHIIFLSFIPSGARNLSSDVGAHFLSSVSQPSCPRSFSPTAGSE
jgi:hypothetical protein